MNGMHVTRTLVRLLTPVLVLVSSSSALGSTCVTRQAPDQPRQVKWHPGHYITLPSGQGNDPSFMRDALNELEGNAALRGIQKRYSWAQLEPTKDRYDFSGIEKDLELLAARGKQLVVLLQLKTFSKDHESIPEYLKTEAYDGGTFELDVRADGNFRKNARTGSGLKLWHPAVRERLIALACAMGRELNEQPHLEAVAITETAIGQPRVALTREQVDGYFDSLVAVHRAWRVAFPNTVTLQFVNYPRSHIEAFTKAITGFGAGVGGPDTFLADRGLEAGAYKLYPALAGVVPLAPSVQPENYAARQHRGPRNPPSPEEIYDFARTRLSANYIFWTRRLVGTDQPWFDVLKFIQSPAFPRDPAGGLAAACPRAFESCREASAPVRPAGR